MSAKGDVIFNSDLSGGHGIIFHKIPGQNLTALVHASFDGTGDISPDGNAFPRSSPSFDQRQRPMWIRRFHLHSEWHLPIGYGSFVLRWMRTLHYQMGADRSDRFSNALMTRARSLSLHSLSLRQWRFLGVSGQLTSIARDGMQLGRWKLFPRLSRSRFRPRAHSRWQCCLCIGSVGPAVRAVFVSSGGAVSRIAGPAMRACRRIVRERDSPRINSLGQVGVLRQHRTAGWERSFSLEARSRRWAASGDTPLPSVTFTYVGSPLINDLGELLLEQISRRNGRYISRHAGSGPRPAGYAAQPRRSSGFQSAESGLKY